MILIVILCVFVNPRFGRQSRVKRELWNKEFVSSDNQLSTWGSRSTYGGELEGFSPTGIFWIRWEVLFNSFHYNNSSNRSVQLSKENEFSVGYHALLARSFRRENCSGLSWVLSICVNYTPINFIHPGFREETRGVFHAQETEPKMPQSHSKCVWRN